MKTHCIPHPLLIVAFPFVLCTMVSCEKTPHEAATAFRRAVPGCTHIETVPSHTDKREHFAIINGRFFHFTRIIFYTNGVIHISGKEVLAYPEAEEFNHVDVSTLAPTAESP